MLDKVDKFRVREGEKFTLSKRDTLVKPAYKDKAEYKEILEAQRQELRDLQEVLYAQDRHSVLLVFQGMDTAGKDGAIRHVMSGVNPSGFQVFSFKKPSSEEMDHNWMWRTNRCMPERGRIGIFNRSHYEEVLVVKVHPGILKSQRIPTELLDEKRVWKQRYQDIVNFEDYAARNGTRVIKFFLHVSKDEQKQRFLARIEDPAKQWKFAEADIRERGYWKDYQAAYEDAIGATSTKRAPWFVIPADDKKNARLIISRIVADEMGKLDMKYPEPGPEHAELLVRAKAQLLAE